MGVRLFSFQMQIITALPKYSDGTIMAALEREIRTGFHLERATEEHRVKAAAAEAATYRGVRNPLLHKAGLRHVAEIPAREYMRLHAKYGKEFESKEFMRDFQKRFPHLSTNRV